MRDLNTVEKDGVFDFRGITHHAIITDKGVATDKRAVPVLSLFEKKIYSGVCKMIKPNRDIFEYLLKECDILPSETLFIDDLQKNIDGAKKCGINGYVFDGDVQKLERYIDELFQENY